MGASNPTEKFLKEANNTLDNIMKRIRLCKQHKNKQLAMANACRKKSKFEG